MSDMGPWGGPGPTTPHRSRKLTFVKSLGCPMYLHEHDLGLTPSVRRYGGWEPLETQVVLHEVKQGETVLDIGANVGYYTLLLAACVGSEGRVIAFEPEPDNLALLEANVRLNRLSNVTVVPKAVSSAGSSLPLYLSEDQKGTHSFWHAYGARRSVVVDAVSLDDYFRDYVGSVDFIKMDIEGAEGHALMGMGQLLRRNDHCRVLTEFSPWNLQNCGTDPIEYLRALRGHGFRLHVLDEYDQRISVAGPQDLFDYGREDPDQFTNLFCTPTDWTWAHWLDEWRTGWAERSALARNRLADLILAGERLIIVDDQALGERLTPEGRESLPFLERDGQYWGTPVDGAHAVRELERLREAGAAFIVFAWPSFWWLDFYPDLQNHLRTRYPCVLEGEQLVAYELARPSAHPRCMVPGRRRRSRHHRPAHEQG